MYYFCSKGRYKSYSTLGSFLRQNYSPISTLYHRYYAKITNNNIEFCDTISDGIYMIRRKVDKKLLDWIFCYINKLESGEYD